MVKIDAAHIESELEQIWEGLESPNKTKAALFNLLVYSQDPQHADYVKAGTEKILSKYPCRVIFVLENPESEGDFLETEVNVETIGTEEVPVSCDRIQISFAGEERERVPFILLPHLLPDLPVFLWWTGNPSLREDLFRLLENQIDRIIFDPDTVDALPRYARSVLKLLERFQGYASDLNWRMIRGWRGAMAYTFGNTEHVEQLKNSDQIAIQYCQRESALPKDARLPAIYLQSWLAASMGWKFVELSGDEERTRFVYEGVEVVLEGVENDELPLGAVMRVEANSRDGYHYAVALEKDLRMLRVERSNTTRCDLPYRLHVRSCRRDSALVSEIFGEGTSPHLQKTLKAIGEIDWSQCP